MCTDEDKNVDIAIIVFTFFTKINFENFSSILFYKSVQKILNIFIIFLYENLTYILYSEWSPLYIMWVL